MEAQIVETEVVEKFDVVEHTGALVRAEVDQQIATAKRYPRSIKAFHNKAKELATLDQETAAACRYRLPARKGSDKPIEGESVRLAEIVAHSYGNLRIDAQVTGIEDKWVIAQAVCMDLEQNVAVRIEKRRRITDRHGRRYSDDMITTTANAATSLAFRDAVFKVVPRALVKPITEAAIKCARGDEKTLAQNRQAAIDFLQVKHGITLEAILSKLGRKGVADITLDDLDELRGYCTAIKDGEVSAKDIFAPEEAEEAPTPINDLNAKLAAKRAAMKAAEAPQPEE